MLKTYLFLFFLALSSGCVASTTDPAVDAVGANGKGAEPASDGGKSCGVNNLNNGYVNSTGCFECAGKQVLSTLTLASDYVSTSGGGSLGNSTGSSSAQSGYSATALQLSNGVCDGISVAQSWPASAALQITGPATATLVDCQQISIPEFQSAPKISIGTDGTYYFSVNLSAASEIPDPTQVATLSIPVQFTGVPQLAGQTLVVTLYANGYEPYSSYGNATTVWQNTTLQFDNSNTPVAVDLPNLCPGAQCLDGSTVMSCPAYSCSSISAGSPVISGSTNQCGGTCPSVQQQQWQCEGL